MSGGSYDYAFRTIQDLSDSLSSQKDPLRRAFGEHLKLVAEAARAIEWVDSGDSGKGDEIEPIEKIVKPELVLDVIKNDLAVLIKQAENILSKE